eukprot:GFKZ01008087.1.p1 GENE.GFKZ01008087.1~~GFKZ01008087.1.p1  ORF type:complete len:135 (-),score=13.89 GFKZ01008087.1:208-612(-)
MNFAPRKTLSVTILFVILVSVTASNVEDRSASFGAPAGVIHATTTKSTDGDLALDVTSRRPIAIVRVFNIARRIRRFSSLAINVARPKALLVRAALRQCIQELRSILESDDPRNLTIFVNSIIALLTWIVCLLN